MIRFAKYLLHFANMLMLQINIFASNQSSNIAREIHRPLFRSHLSCSFYLAVMYFHILWNKNVFIFN